MTSLSNPEARILIKLILLKSKLLELIIELLNSNITSSFGVLRKLNTVD
jgi:hypothetical protein